MCISSSLLFYIIIKISLNEVFNIHFEQLCDLYKLSH